jgi:hypothetical protein
MIRQPQHQKPGPVFVIKLRPTRADSDGLRGLRWILKTLLRRHGFQCIDAREQQSPTEGVSDEHTEAETTSR